MKISDDVEMYLKYYMENICILGKLQMGAIQNLAMYKSQGSEYISCSYDPEDEDYKEGYVTLYFWKPAAEQDMMIFVDNYKFYNYLLKIIDGFIKEDTKANKVLKGYLEKIKTDLGIKEQLTNRENMDK